jgi:hypothetical protein
MVMGFLRHVIIVLRQELAVANAPGAALMMMGGGGGKGGAPGGQLSSSVGGGVSDGLLNGDDYAVRVPPAAVKAALPFFGQGHMRRHLASRFLQRHRWALALVDVVVFGANSTLGFLNMLIVMTYNPGLMMAVVAGEMVGVLLLEVPGGGAMELLEGRDATCH